MIEQSETTTPLVNADPQLLHELYHTSFSLFRAKSDLAEARGHNAEKRDSIKANLNYETRLYDSFTHCASVALSGNPGLPAGLAALYGWFKKDASYALNSELLSGKINKILWRLSELEEKHERSFKEVMQGPEEVTQLSFEVKMDLIYQTTIGAIKEYDPRIPKVLEDLKIFDRLAHAYYKGNWIFDEFVEQMETLLESDAWTAYQKAKLCTGATISSFLSGRNGDDLVTARKDITRLELCIQELKNLGASIVENAMDVETSLLNVQEEGDEAVTAIDLLLLSAA